METHLHWYWTWYLNMYGVVDFLLDLVRLWNMYRHFDNFFDLQDNEIIHISL